MNHLYKSIGISKQAVNQYQKRQNNLNEQAIGLMAEVDALREEYPGCGVEKMYHTLRPEFIGRDKFIELFMSLGYRVKRPKNYIRTTVPGHLSYPNLIEGMYVNRPNQIWQSDITYFQVKGRFYYLVFIIDVYTRKIIGYQVSDNMRAEANIKALKQAIKSQKVPLKGLIHHSDRGSQYVSNKYRELLSMHGIHISMGLKGQDNAYAERINGTIKNQYLRCWKIETYRELRARTKDAVSHYNNKRIHDSLPQRNSPCQFEESLVSLSNGKRPEMVIHADGRNKVETSYYQGGFAPDRESNTHFCPTTSMKILN